MRLPPSDRDHVFERFFKLTPAMLCIADFKGRFWEVNRAFEETLGYSGDELTSQPFLNFIHPDDIAATQHVMQRIVEHQEPIAGFENRYLCKDKTWKTIAWETVAFREQGIIYAIARDVTQIRAVEQALRSSQQNLAITLKSIGEGVIVIDQARKITLINPIASQLTGWTPAEAEGQRLEEILILASDEQNPVFSLDHLFLRAGVTRLVARDQSECIVAHSCTPLQAEDGQGVGHVIIVRDITSEVASREDLQRQTSRSLRYQQALLRLRDFDTRDLTSLFALATEQCAISLDIERASIWIFRDNHSYLECVDLYCASTHAHSAGHKLYQRDYPVYFDAIRNLIPIIAHDAYSHAITSVFRETYLKVLGIRSMIDLPIRAGGELIGVMCCEHVGAPREWVAGEVKFVTSLAASIMLAIEQNQRIKVEWKLRDLNATLEKRIEDRTAELTAKEARFRALFHSQFQFIGLLTPAGTLLEANEAFLQIAGISADSVLGLHFWDTPWWNKSPEDQQRLKEAIAQAAAGQFIRYEVDLQGENGRIVSVDFSIKPVLNEEGVVTLLIPEGRDITEKKMAEKALRDGENRFRLMLEQVEDYAIFLLDPEGRVANWNRGAEKAKGFAASEVIGHHFSLFYTPEDTAAGRPDFLLSVARQKGYVQDEGWRMRRDGSRFWAGVTITALHDETNTLTGFTKVTHDLSERRRTEIALRESEEQFRSAMEYSAVGMALVSPSGALLKVNKALCDFVGYSEEELLKTDFQSITFPEDLQADLDLVLATLRGERATFQMEKRYVRKDGDVVWALLTVALVRDAHGLPKYFISQIQDITRRKKADEVLRNALLHEKELVRRAKAGEKAKSDFLAVMSHEIRTPLNGILGFADLLAQSSDLDSEKLDHARTIVESGESLLRILDDILDFSRLEVGRMKIEKRPFSPHKLVHDIGTLLYPLARKKELEIRYDIDPTLNAIRSGDGTRVRQILLNLGGNAVKFTEKGSVTFSARVTPDDPDWVEFSVTDTGPGIPPVLRESIFEPFIQGDLSASRKHTGSGLGLAISRRLARLMGGSLSVQSQNGMGSRFSLFLPLGNPGRFPAITSERSFKMSFQDQDLASLHPLRILVAEDDRTSLKLIQRILSLFGYEAASATNGEEAVEIYRKEAPDLILMDLQMPAMDGIAATRRIRALEATEERAKCFISALTANIVPEDKKGCFDSGMNSYLNKPIKKDQLVEIIIEASAHKKTVRS